MRGSLNTNSKIVLAGALGLGSIVGLAAPALAETPAHQDGGMVLELPAPQPEPGDIIVNPTPEPEAPKDKGTPKPAPKPEAPKDKAPAPQGDPEPQPELPNDKAPLPQGDPNPNLPDGPDGITDAPDCTHGCGGGGPLDGPDELTDRPDEQDTPEDVPAAVPADAEVESASVAAPTQDSSDDRGALPRTGAGLTLLAAAGAGLTAVGAAARKLARR